MRPTISDYFRTALEKLGPQGWWPGETAFEICVGAILTQNTNWKNVEKALANLKSRDLLDPHRMFALDPAELASLIRPAGYFRIKTKRLRNFLKFLIESYDGNLEAMKSERTESLREKILSINGIGPETADSILLYALGKNIFVVDAYTKRIFTRHGVLEEDADYHAIQDHFSRHLSEDAQSFNEFHALIVHVGKNWCKTREPDCAHCPWKDYLEGEVKVLPERFP
jgi:endonuclease-3 related protein